MKQILALMLMAVAQLSCTAQQQTLDYLVYTAPKGWTKEVKQNSIVYSIVNKKTKAWSQIVLFKATASKGGIELDFDNEWSTLVMPLGVAAQAQATDIREADGWKIKNAGGSFSFNGSTAIASLTTISGYQVCFSILANTNSEEHIRNIQDFLSSIRFTKPGNVTEPATTSSPNTAGPTTPLKDRYAFNTTNFDDGWTSTIHEDWVQVVKGQIRVLIHYPKEGTIFPADPEPLMSAAWNILVAPRYSSASGFKYVSTPLDFERAYMCHATVTDKNGGSYYVVLFRKAGGWIEFISPDKKAFVAEFGVDADKIAWDSPMDIFGAMVKMAGYNRFAVALSDINDTGTWADNFSSNTFYANYYTGQYAGMSTYSSSQWFEFSKAQRYTWELVATNSYGGKTNFAKATGNGTVKSLNNWQLYFSNIEGKAKTYDVYFSAVKGGRVLWMNDTNYKGSGIYTGFVKKAK